MDPEKFRKLLVPILIVVLLLLGGGGIFLILSAPSEEDRVGYALDDLVSAVEARDPELFASRIHEDYHGWGHSHDLVVDAFRGAINRYETADIDLRDVQITVDDDTANATFEWTAGAKFETQTYRIDTTLRKPPYTEATLEFRKDKDDRWQLSDMQTNIPHPEP
ncbi:nuclear transport factor 2 family protein [bacterium]|nr:nuclear transport factor 2 family protein [bacterium]